jgi:WD40 repeat protein
MIESVAPKTTKPADSERFPSFPALIEGHSQLLQREPMLDNREYVTEVKQFFERARATGKILDNPDERRTAQTILNYWVTILFRTDSGKPALTTLAEYDPSSVLEFDPTHCPYPGVRAFREDESRFFFGRQRQINYLLARLREERLLVISGPSGSGKTSLVLAGLLPGMKLQDELNGTKRYYFPTITPGRLPLENLNRLFATSSDQTNATDLATGKDAKPAIDFGQDYKQLLSRISAVTQLPAVIVIDQFEQVFTRVSDRDRRAYMRSLHRVYKTGAANNIVILIMRDGDFDPYLRTIDRKILDPAKVSLGALGSTELRDAIEKPAAYVGVKFEQSTVEALVKDILSEPVGLPLLQFALSKLWDSRVHGSTVNAAKMPSARTMLAQKADAVFEELDSRDRRIAEQSLGRLIKINKELTAYSYPAARADLYLRTEKNSRVDNLIKKLSDAELLRVHPGAVPEDDEIELVHDSLIRTWPRMVKWVESKKRKRLWNRMAAAALVVIAVSIVLLLMAYMEGKREQGVQSRELAALSVKQLSYGRLDLALLFGREAYRVERNSLTTSNLLRLLYALQSTTCPQTFLYRDGFQASDTAFSAEKGDPQMLAAVDYDGKIVIWNLAAKQIALTLSSNDATSPLAFSPDGKTLATSATGSNANVILWDVNTGQRRDLSLSRTATGEQPVIQSLAFSPDSATLITGDDEGKVIEWDLAKASDSKTIYQHDQAVTSLSVNQKFVASGSKDGKIVLSPRGGKKSLPLVLQGHKSVDDLNTQRQIVSLAFGDEHPLLAVGTSRDVMVWDFEKRKRIVDFSSGPAPGGLLVSFSNHDQFLSAFGFEGTLIIWDLDTQSPVGRQFYNPGANFSATFSSNGVLLAFPAADGVQVWKTITDRTVNADGAVNTLAFDRNGILAVGHGNGVVLSWQVSSPEKHQEDKSTAEVSRVYSMSFSEDGSLLALGLEDGTISLRNASDYSLIKTLNAQTGVVKNAVGGSSSMESSANPPDAAGNPVRVVKVVFDPSPGSKRLAALIEPQDPSTGDASNDKRGRTKAVIWDTSTGSLTQVPVDPNGVVTSIALDADGTLAFATTDNHDSFKVVLWNRDQQTTFLPCQSPCHGKALSLAFSHTTRMLAAGLDDGKVVLWNLNSNARISDDAIGSAIPVTDLAFNPNDTLLAATTNEKPGPIGSRPGAITLLDMATQSPAGSLLMGHRRRVSAIAFSPDGKVLASASSDSESVTFDWDYKIILWDLNLDDVDNRFCEIANCSVERPIVSANIKKRSWFQALYSRVSKWLGESASAP